MEDIIKARIVFDGMGGAVGGIPSGATATATVLTKKGMQSAVTIPITDVLGSISRGIKTLSQFSPMLNAEFIRMRKGLELMLMPIGDTMANFLRPFTVAWLDTAQSFYQDYREGGFWSAMESAMGNVWKNLGWTDETGHINFEGNIDDLLTIGSVLVIGGAILAKGFTSIVGMVGASLGLGAGMAGGMAGGVSKLLIPAALFLGGKILGDLIGLGNSGIVSLIATSLGLGVAALTGGGLAVAIPVALGVIGIGWGIQELTKDMEETTKNLEKLGLIGAGKDQTRSFRYSPLTGAIEEVSNSASKMSEDLQLPPEIQTGIKSITTNFLGLGDQIDTNDLKVLNLSTRLKELPNIDRTINYHVNYVYD